MRLKTLATGIAAASLALSPVLAHAQTAASPARAGAEMQEASGQFTDDEGNINYVVVGLITVVIVIAIYFIFIEDEGRSTP